MSSYNDFSYRNAVGENPVSMNPLYNIYTCDLSPGSPLAYTFTLPAITTDGMKFKVSRIDRNSNYQVVQTIGTTDPGPIIYVNGTLVTTINIGIDQVADFISYGGIWYLCNLSEQSQLPLRALASGNFTPGSGTSVYKAYFGNGSVPVLIASFAYKVSHILDQIISGGSFVIYFISGTPTVRITLRDSTGGTVIGSTNSTLISAQTTLTFSSLDQTLLPSSTSALTLYIEISGTGADSIGLASFMIY